jgi:hypothetical protein
MRDAVQMHIHIRPGLHACKEKMSDREDLRQPQAIVNVVCGKRRVV